MSRTTLDIDDSILQELKLIQAIERRPLGSIVSELLAKALSERTSQRPDFVFTWISKPMGEPLVDLEDKDALFGVLDEADEH